MLTLKFSDIMNDEYRQWLTFTVLRVIKNNVENNFLEFSTNYLCIQIHEILWDLPLRNQCIHACRKEKYRIRILSIEVQQCFSFTQTRLCVGTMVFIPCELFIYCVQIMLYCICHLYVAQLSISYVNV